MRIRVISMFLCSWLALQCAPNASAQFEVRARVINRAQASVSSDLLFPAANTAEISSSATGNAAGTSGIAPCSEAVFVLNTGGSFATVSIENDSVTACADSSEVMVGNFHFSGNCTNRYISGTGSNEVRVGATLVSAGAQDKLFTGTNTLLITMN